MNNVNLWKQQDEDQWDDETGAEEGKMANFEKSYGKGDIRG